MAGWADLADGDCCCCRLGFGLWPEFMLDMRRIWKEVLSLLVCCWLSLWHRVHLYTRVLSKARLAVYNNAVSTAILHLVFANPFNQTLSSILMASVNPFGLKRLNYVFLDKKCGFSHCEDFYFLFSFSGLPFYYERVYVGEIACQTPKYATHRKLLKLPPCS